MRMTASLAALLLLAACHKGPSNDAPPVRSSAPLVGASVTHAPPPAPPSASSGISIPTPEDAEEDAAHRITDQNLESELDRLEREIQAQ